MTNVMMAVYLDTEYLKKWMAISYSHTRSKSL